MSQLPEEIIAQCFPLAHEAFACGRKFLLIHSVQAVERIVSKWRSKPLSIRVLEKPTFRARTGKRAGSRYFHDSTESDITVDSNLSLEDKRRLVAHELGHILLSALLIKRALGAPDRAEPSHERWCQDFENRLCKLLQYLYIHTPFNDGMAFPSLEEAVRNEFEDLKTSAAYATCSFL